MVFLRFFNGALDESPLDIFVNGGLIAGDLQHGGFTPFRRAKPGVYQIELRFDDGDDQMDYTELLSFMDDTAYTLALTGDAARPAMSVLTMDTNGEGRRPALRFANLMAAGDVIDIKIDGQRAAEGLMFRDVSDEIEIGPGDYVVTVYDAGDDKIMEDGMEIRSGGSYLGIVAGQLSNWRKPPTLFMAEDHPIL